MSANHVSGGAWPALPLEGWRETYDTLHMWTQVIGKVVLATSPLTNHYWNIAFQLVPRGLRSLPMHSRGRTLTATFDFMSHELVLECSDGKKAAMALQPMTVARFHESVMSKLREMEVEAHIWTMPVEFADPIRFEEDTVHNAYDAERASAFWRALVSMQPVFERFRAQFLGKCSPLHFFWGSFDLALTRFNGRRAAQAPDADALTREAYSHEVISHGFWPGSGSVAEPAFYAYAAPEPEGFREAKIRPAAARYNTEFSNYILPYEAVRTAASPEDELRSFLESTYAEAARLAGWNRAELER
jgi:uncharacterized protein DUF5996